MTDRNGLTLADTLVDFLDHEIVEGARSSSCQACGALSLVGFYEAKGIPTQSTVLLDSRSEAEAFPIGDLLLGFCAHCGLIQNVIFDEELVDYSVPTEESQAFSPKFSAYAEDLADRLVSELNLEGRSILEVGCGKGDFLKLLSERGIARGVGIDPGFLPERADRAGAKLEFIRDWFGPEHLDLTGDLVVARHLMEHVPNAKQFLTWLGQVARETEGASVFIEVPDTDRVLEEGAFWDVYYEHCSYFTESSLSGALGLAGLEVDRLEKGFDDQYLLAWASPGENYPHVSRTSILDETEAKIPSFARKAAAGVDYWRQRIESKLEREGDVAIWGASSKTVAFLATIGIGPMTAVDINPYKQSKWLPSVGIKVESPKVLIETRPLLVIPMNPIYVDEIRADLTAMGLSPEIEPV